MLAEFQVKKELNPLQLAKIEKSGRIRATRKTKNSNKTATHSDW